MISANENLRFVAIFLRRDRAIVYGVTISLPVADSLVQGKKTEIDDNDEAGGNGQPSQRQSRERLAGRSVSRPRWRRIVRLPNTKRFAVVGAARTCRSAGRCACP